MTEILNLSCQSVDPGILQEKLRRQKLERKEICKLSPHELWVYDTSRFDPVISWYLLDEQGEITESGDMMLGCIGSPYVFFYIKEEMFKKKKFPVPVVFSNVQRAAHSVPVVQHEPPVIVTPVEQCLSPTPSAPSYNTTDGGGSDIRSAWQDQPGDIVTHHTYVPITGAGPYMPEDHKIQILYNHYYSNGSVVQPANHVIYMQQPASRYLYAATGTSPPSAVS